MGTKVELDYGALARRAEQLPTATRIDVMRLHYQAVSYVWGYQDAVGGVRDSGEAWNFGLAYWDHVLSHREGNSSQTSLKDAFQAWRASGEIKRV